MSKETATIEAPPGVPFDPLQSIELITGGILEDLRDLGRGGAVVAISGGIDSSVVAALCVQVLSGKRVALLQLPEREGSTEASRLGTALADFLEVTPVVEPVTEALEAMGCYARRDQAIREVFADYEPGWPHKVTRSAPQGGITFFSLVIERPDGSREQRRIPPSCYRALIAATNMKQRVRKLIEYTWADRLGYAVAGTPNLLEFDQGFFVKGGDGLADLKPIAGLYKSQVYAAAEELGVPAAIRSREPTTDTFSLAQSQEEFFFGYPHEVMDLLMWGERQSVPASELSAKMELSGGEVEAGYLELRRRRIATRYLHATPKPAG